LFKPLQEGDKLEAASIVRGTIIAADPVRDLALVKVAYVPPHVRPLEFGPAKDIQVGTDVHAIGHPNGEAWTYTKGIISQVRRDFEWGQQGSTLHRATVIQTQTPINAGNSGGPLLDDSGKLLGVNSFKAADAENLNFAISVEDVSAFLKSRNPPFTLTKPRPSCELRRLSEGRDRANKTTLTNFDLNCDGKVDSSLFVPDRKSEAIEFLIDRNSDGDADVVIQDRNRDGKWDISFHDVNFDGTTDLVGRSSGSPYERKRRNLIRRTFNSATVTQLFTRSVCQCMDE
jgi:hypothetical protein